MRVVEGNAATIPALFLDDSGDGVDVGSVAVVVLDGAGDEIAAGAAGAGTGTGAYTFDLTAQSQLDRLHATFTGTGRAVVVTVDVVGRRLVEMPRITSDAVLGAKDAETIARLLEETETTFRDIVGFPVVPEGARLRSASPGGPRLLLPDVLYPLELYDVTQDDEVVDLSSVVARTGFLERSGSSVWTAGTTIRTHLSHGLQEPPAYLREAALVYMRYRSRGVDSKIPERATRFTDEGADILLSQPGRDHPTGIPDVDSHLVRLRADVLV